MWCPTQARRPRARQKVFFCSAPQANIGEESSGRLMLAGTYPRERLTDNGAPEVARTTESSARTWIGRSCSRNRSAIGARRSRASSSR